MIARLILTISPLALLVSCGIRFPELETQDHLWHTEINTPLTKFAQELATTHKELVLKHGEITHIPVTIRNVTETTLVSAGRYPITLNYRWYDGANMLPIEGNRTFLHRPIEANDQESVLATVKAPQSGTCLTLRFSLVQEGITWFSEQNARTLDIPVRLQP